MTRHTSEMNWPLEEPNGWFLAAAGHQHKLEGMAHWVPEPLTVGPWYVTFQKTDISIQSISANGFSLAEAWEKAANMVMDREMGRS